NRLKTIIFKSALMPLDCTEEKLPYYPLNRTGKVDADFVFMNGTISKRVYISSLNCMNIFEKSISDINVCEYNSDRKQNHYTTNHKGTYTPKKSYTFLADRKSSASNTAQPNLKSDGFFVNQTTGLPFFTPFWRNTGNIWDKFTNNWTWTAEVTKIHPNGNELESKDPLDRYSSELLGYNDHMVTAVAGNARYGDCMFDGFEDYRYENGIAGGQSCPYKYFKFPEAEPVKDLAESHSGKYYQPLQPGHISWAEYDLYKCKENLPVPEGRITQPDTTDNSKPCDCLNEFNPQPGKYVFSGWIKEENDPLQHDYLDGKYIIRVDGNVYEFKAKGPIIEGWQRVHGEFVIPEGSRKIYIGLSASPSEITGFDDIRIHPFNASFKSFVYDDITLRFTYELDENNYFTKYEYDASGKLERVKKETERGVMTVQESRFSNKKSKN
ncbi:MAG: hypothetical protein K1X55_18210, partial [Chitinophagales bacterium]|nr:hypothetical protein [Chitinophagales bacterium]